MERLSINDLNNLTGVSSEELDTLYTNFRSAHTKLYNDANRWINTYNKLNAKFKSNNTGASEFYHEFKAMYYKGSMLLDTIDMFEKYTSEYQSMLSKLRLNDDISKIRSLCGVFNNMKANIKKYLNECYTIYDALYTEYTE